MYKSEKQKKLKDALEELTIYSDTLCFDIDDTAHLEALEIAGEMAKDLRVGNYVNDLNGRNAIEAAKEEKANGNMIAAVFIITRETGRGLKDAHEFVTNGFTGSVVMKS
jgi:hypothetical protein